MKKLIYFFALLGIVSMASCSGKSNNASTTEVVMVTDSLVPDTATIAVYEGILREPMSQEYNTYWNWGRPPMETVSTSCL